MACVTLEETYSIVRKFQHLEHRAFCPPDFIAAAGFAPLDTVWRRKAIVVYPTQVWIIDNLTHSQPTEYLIGSTTIQPSTLSNGQEKCIDRISPDVVRSGEPHGSCGCTSLATVLYCTGARRNLVDCSPISCSRESGKYASYQDRITHSHRHHQILSLHHYSSPKKPDGMLTTHSFLQSSRRRNGQLIYS